MQFTRTKKLYFSYELASAKKPDVCSKSIQVCIAHNFILKKLSGARVCVSFSKSEREICVVKGKIK